MGFLRKVKLAKYAELGPKKIKVTLKINGGELQRGISLEEVAWNQENKILMKHQIKTEK